MHYRYEDEQIKNLFADENKLKLWMQTELALIKARENLGRIPRGIYDQIKEIWDQTPIDIVWWKNRDKAIGHDLNSFIDERVRLLPPEYQSCIHVGSTSYDTEESPFINILNDALSLVIGKRNVLNSLLTDMAHQERFTLMMARTHGQEAEPQSFGARIISWNNDYMVASQTLDYNLTMLGLSKFSGGTGRYNTIDPELEKEVLAILGFEPYYGATQIMPRVIYAQLAETLENMVAMIHKIANDIRLSARSGLTLMREPFGKKQKGSSIFVNKKNPIGLEQIEGIYRMVKGYVAMLRENSITTEERAIEQSCVERVAWPDLFHDVLRAHTVIHKTLKNLVIYRDNMLEEIKMTRGTYAVGKAKEFIKEHISPFGLDYEDAYRLCQLACFNVFEVSQLRQEMRDFNVSSATAAINRLEMILHMKPEKIYSIQDLIKQGALRPSNELDISKERVKRYNEVLKEIFSELQTVAEWDGLFDLSDVFEHESILYENIM